MTPEMRQRIANKVMLVESGCLIWTAALAGSGYPTMTYEGRTHAPHKLMWEAANRPLTSSEVLSRTCKDRRCILPDHAVPRTRAQAAATRNATARRRPPLELRSETWMALGACTRIHIDEVAETFFGPDPTAAKAACSRCPVRDECLEFAVTNDVTIGVYGGLTPKERAL